MRVRWYREAQNEAIEAARFYQEKQPGLEQHFLDTLEEAIHRIQRRPQMYSINPAIKYVTREAHGIRVLEQKMHAKLLPV